MLTYLMRPPSFQDPEKNRIAFLLHSILTVGMILLLGASFAMYLMGYLNSFEQSLAAVIVLSHSINLMLLNRGYVRSASYLYTLVYWALCSIIIVLSGGLFSPFIISYGVILLLGAILLGLRGGLIIAALTLASIVFTAVLSDTANITPLIPVQDINYWLVLVLTQMTVLAFCLILFARSLRRTFHKNERITHELREKNQLLSQELEQHLETQKQLEEAAHFQEGLRTLLAEVLRADRPENVYKILLENAIQVIPHALTGSVMRVDEDVLRFVAVEGYDFDILAQVSFTLEEIFGNNNDLEADSFLKRNLRNSDQRAFSAFQREKLRQAGTGHVVSTLGVPIHIGDALTAVLWVDSDKEDAFNENAQRMAETFATQVSLVMQRLEAMQEAELVAQQYQHLYDETRQQAYDLERRVRFQDALGSLTYQLLRTQAEDAYQVMLDQAVTAIPGADAGLILIKEEADYTFASSRGLDIQRLKTLKLNLEELFAYHELDNQVSILIHDLDTFVHEVYEPRKARLFGQVIRKAKIKVGLGLPILVGAEVTGVIWLVSQDQEGFDPSSRVMAETFAAQINLVLQRLNAMRQAEETTAKLNAAIAALPDDIYMVDRHGFVHDINPGQVEKSRDRKVAISNLFNEALAERVHEKVQAAMTTAEVQVLEQMLSQRPTIRALETRISAIDQDMALLLVRDISSQKIAETEILHAKEEAEKANQAKSEFLSRMSHELRTPMNAILGFAQLMELEDLNEELADSVSRITRAGRHLLGLINEVLDISRIESGNLSLRMENVTVSQVVQEVVSFVAPLADEHRIIVEIDDDSLNGSVHADFQRCKQILLNLLSNAIKYNSTEGQVRVYGQRLNDRYFRIAVSDTGLGISEEQLERLFVPFERLGAEKSNIDGIGIGLALSKRLADLMNGRLSVASEVGQGSTFFLDLLLAEAEFVQIGDALS